MVYGRGCVVADTYLCIGNAYMEIGKHVDAFDNFKESILIRENLLKDTAAVLPSNNFICDTKPLDEDIVLQYSKYIECLEAYSPLHKRLCHDPKVDIECLQKLGESYFNIRDYDNAMKRYVSFKHLFFQITLMLIHAATFRYLSALDLSQGSNKTHIERKIGLLHILKQEYSEAQKVLIQCLTTEKAEHGEESPVLFPTIYYLGVALDYMKKHQHSLAIISKGAEIIEDANDINVSLQKLYAYFWIGKQQFALQDYASAVASFLRVLALTKESKDAENAGVIIKTLHCLGDAHLAQENLQMALKSYNGEIQLFETQGSDNNKKNISYAQAYCSAGCVHAKMKVHEKAKACYEKALTVLPKGSKMEVASTLFALGEINREQGRHHEAKEIMTSAFNLFQETKGTNNDVTISSAMSLAKLHDIMEDFESAMTYYRICLSAQEHKYGSNHEKVGTVLFYMGKNCISRSEYGNASTFLERVSIL